MTAAEAPARAPTPPGLYDNLTPAERYLHTTRDEAWIDLLRRHDYSTLRGLRVLELGCGEGWFARSLVHYGAEPALLDGFDINPVRIARAQKRAGSSRLLVADGATLPYRSETFDLAFAFTFFSSVVDPAPRRRAATEAMRVLRPGALLVVYDFWINPLNTHVRPIGPTELRSFFAPRAVELQRVTLAPPIVRALGGRAAACRPLERLTPLRTHLLAAVTKERR